MASKQERAYSAISKEQTSSNSASRWNLHYSGSSESCESIHAYSEPPPTFFGALCKRYWLLILLLSLTNVIQFVQIIHIKTGTNNQAYLSKEIEGLSLKRDKIRQLGSSSAYNSENQTAASEAWQSMLTGHGVVALSEEYAIAHNLPETSSFKGENDTEAKRIYVIEAYHAMHCIRMLRIHYRALEEGTTWDWSKHHDYHCFDSIRQYIMCNPDYTLLRSTGHRDAGYLQYKHCMDWDALRDWAEQFPGNYFDNFDAVSNSTGKELLNNYHAGDGLPIGSL